MAVEDREIRIMRRMTTNFLNILQFQLKLSSKKLDLGKTLLRIVLIAESQAVSLEVELELEL